MSKMSMMSKTAVSSSEGKGITVFSSTKAEPQYRLSANSLTYGEIEM